MTAKTARLRQRMKGRKEDGSFLRLVHMMIRDPAWRGLSPNAKAAFIDIASRYTGTNNGDIAMPRRDLTSHGWGANGVRFSAAVDELIVRGFVVITLPGSVGTGMMTRYAITSEPLDAHHGHSAEHKASHLWRERKIACTTAVQGSALRQCNATRKTDSNCTKTVRTGEEIVNPPSTDLVQA